MAGPTVFQLKRTSISGREANTETLPNVGEMAINLTDGRMWVANSSNVFEIGANVSISRVSTQIYVGNSTVNVFANSTIIKLSNSTVNTAISVPTTTQYAGDYFLHANGTWAEVVAGATPDGANTEIQYNLSGALGANQNFTFDQATSKFTVGNTTINATITDAILKLANSTVNTQLTIPTAAAYGATNYFLHANGSWVQIASGSGSVRVYQRYTATAAQATFTVGGGYTINQIEVFHSGIHLANNEYTQDGADIVLNEAALEGAIIEVAGWIQLELNTYVPVSSGDNTQVQFNDSMLFGGTAGFTFNKDTNNALIANTLTIGTATINSTNYSQTANNALYLGGTAAANYALDTDMDGYQTEAGLSANVATLSANNTNYLGGNISANSTGAYPISNTSGAVLGNTISRFILTGNTVTVSGGLYPGSNSLGTALGSATQRWVITGNTITCTGTAAFGNTTVTGFVNASTGFFKGTDAVLYSGTADQTITGGARVTVNDLGNSGTGTITPDPGDRPMQKYTNNGAHTLAPGTNYGNYLLDIINTTGAGAITTSGWTKVSGDSFDTTTTSKFRCHCSVTADCSSLIVTKIV